MMQPKAQPMPLPFTYPHELPSSCVFMLDMQDGLAAVTSNNLSPLSACKFEGWAAHSGAVATLTQGQAIQDVTTDGATRIQTNGGTSSLKYYCLILPQSALGVTYKHSVWIYVPDGQPSVKIRSNIGAVSATINAGSITKIELSSVGDGATPLQFRIEALNAGDNLDFYAYQPMVNEGTAVKPYEPGYIPSRGTLLTDHAALSRKWTNTGGVWVPSLNLLAWQGDGVDDKISYGSDLVSVGDVTFECVFRATGWGGSGGGRIIDNGQFRANINGTTKNIDFASANGGTAISTPNDSIELNNTYYIVVTRRADSKSSIYLNGNLSGGADRATSTPQAGVATVIGNRAANDRAFAGTIGMAALYKGIWSAQNVAARYAEIAALYGLAG